MDSPIKILYGFIASPSEHVRPVIATSSSQPTILGDVIWKVYLLSYAY
jgi:hypothetical protein